MPSFQDQQLVCKDCGNTFVWTAGEQEFYQQKGFTNPPTRCPDCRAKKKAAAYGQRKQYTITCSNCGKQDTVPFQPRGDRPVLCRDCFAKQKAGEVLTPKTDAGKQQPQAEPVEA